SHARAGMGEPRKVSKRVYKALMDRRTGFSAVALRALLGTLATPPTETAIISALGDRDFYPVEEVIDFLRGGGLRAALPRVSVGTRLKKEDVVAAANHQEGYSRNRMLVLLHERK